MDMIQGIAVGITLPEDGGARVMLVCGTSISAFAASRARMLAASLMMAADEIDPPTESVATQAKEQ